MKAEDVYKDLQTKKYKPVYFLQGEEPFFIDTISDFIEQKVLTDDEKVFNLTVLYGLETNADEVVVTAKRFPMMSDYQVVIVKEAQLMKDIDKIEKYIEKPQKSTLLVFCYKGKSLDKRKTFSKTIAQHAVLMDSEKLKDKDVLDWIGRQTKRKGYLISNRAVMMLHEFVGSDLQKLNNEIEKLAINLNKGATISDEMVEQQVGVSREFNVFELQNAITKRDVFKANKIVFWMADNQKVAPMPVVMSNLFNFFSKILHLQYAKAKNLNEIPKLIGVHPFYLKDYEEAARVYPLNKTIYILHELKNYDLKSKGYNNASAQPGDLLKELIFKILH